MKILFFVIFLLFSVKLEHKENYKYPNYITLKQLDCLVKNAYHEAHGEGPLGMLLVTQVVLNRAKNKKNYCAVIYQYKQFSWTLEKEKKISREDNLKISELILLFYNGKLAVPDNYKNITHFHTIYVKPYWSRKIKPVGSYRNHVFYQQRI